MTVFFVSPWALHRWVFVVFTKIGRMKPVYEVIGGGTGGPHGLCPPILFLGGMPLPLLKPE